MTSVPVLETADQRHWVVRAGWARTIALAATRTPHMPQDATSATVATSRLAAVEVLVDMFSDISPPTSAELDRLLRAASAFRDAAK